MFNPFSESLTSLHALALCLLTTNLHQIDRRPNWTLPFRRFETLKKLLNVSLRTVRRIAEQKDAYKVLAAGCIRGLREDKYSKHDALLLSFIRLSRTLNLPLPLLTSLH